MEATEQLVLSNEMIQLMLEKFLEGKRSGEDLQNWAVMIEGREDIAISKNGTDVIFELANPLVVEAINQVRIKELMKYLDQADE